MTVAARKDVMKKSDPANPEFTTSDSPFYWLVRVLRGHVREMDVVLKRIGLDTPRWRIITVLTEIEPASISLLAEHCAMQLSTMTKTIQRLELDGIVRTRTSKADARVTVVENTAKGKKLVGISRASASPVFRRTFAGLDDAEIARFIGTLQRIHANIFEFHD